MAEESIFVDAKQLVKYLANLQDYFQDHPDEEITPEINKLVARLIKDFGIETSGKKLFLPQLLDLIISKICTAEGINREELAKSGVPDNLDKLVEDLERALAADEVIKEKVNKSIEMLKESYGVSEAFAEKVVAEIIQREQAELEASVKGLPSETANALAKKAAPVVVEAAVRSQAGAAPKKGVVFQEFRRLASSPAAGEKRPVARFRPPLATGVKRAAVLVNTSIIAESVWEAGREIRGQTSQPQINKEDASLIAVQLADIAQREKALEIKGQEPIRSKAARWSVIIAHRLKPVAAKVSPQQVKEVVNSLLGLGQIGQTGQADRAVPEAAAIALQKLSSLPDETRSIISQEITRSLRFKLEKKGVPAEAAQTIANLIAATQPEPAFYRMEIPREELPPEIEEQLSDESKERLKQRKSLPYQKVVEEYLQRLTPEQEEAVWPLTDDETGQPTWWGRVVSRQFQNLTRRGARKFLLERRELPEQFSWLQERLSQLESLNQAGELRQTAGRFLWRSFRERFLPTGAGGGWRSSAGSLFRKAGDGILQIGKNLGNKAVISLKGLMQKGGSVLAKAIPQAAGAISKMMAGLGGAAGTAIAGTPVGWIIAGILIVVVVIAIVALSVIGSSHRLSMRAGSGLSPGEINSVEMSDEELAALGDQPALAIQRAFEKCGIDGKATIKIIQKSESCLAGQGVSRRAIRALEESAKSYYYLQCVAFVKAAVPNFPAGHHASWFADHQPSGWNKVADRNKAISQNNLIGSLAVWGPSSRCEAGQRCEDNSSCCGHIAVITGVEKGQPGSLSYLYVTQAWGDSGKISTIKVALNEPTTILKRQ